jgi:hypothetical protein
MSGVGGGHMAHVVREALDAVAAPATRDQILERALFVAGIESVPDHGSALRDFVDHFLRQAMVASLGEANAEQVVRDLEPIVRMAQGNEGPPALDAHEEPYADRAGSDEDVSQVRCVTTRPPPAGLDDQIEIDVILDGSEDWSIGLGSAIEELMAPSPPRAFAVETETMTDPLGFGAGPLELPEPLDLSEPNELPGFNELLEPDECASHPGLGPTEPAHPYDNLEMAPPVSGPYPRHLWNGDDATPALATPPRRSFERAATEVDDDDDDELSGERSTRPRIVFASRDEDTVEAFARALRDVGTLIHAADAFALVEAFEADARAPDVVVVDGRFPSVQPATLAALGPDLPQRASVVVWGGSDALMAQLGAGGTETVRWRSLGPEVSVWEVVEVCSSLFSGHQVVRAAR